MHFKPISGNTTKSDPFVIRHLTSFAASFAPLTNAELNQGLDFATSRGLEWKGCTEHMLFFVDLG